MQLVGICPRCQNETSWDNYFEEIRCIPCGWTYDATRWREIPGIDGYGGSNPFPQRITFAIYHPSFEWSEQPVFEKWEIEAVIEEQKTNSIGNYDYVLAALIPVRFGLWPHEIVDAQQFGRTTRRRVLKQFQNAIRKAIAARLKCPEERIRGLAEVVKESVHQADIKNITEYEESTSEVED